MRRKSCDLSQEKITIAVNESESKLGFSFINRIKVVGQLCLVKLWLGLVGG